jgi:diguanylate cyclase (GGDEF)-like protein
VDELNALLPLGQAARRQCAVTSYRCGVCRPLNAGVPEARNAIGLFLFPTIMSTSPNANALLDEIAAALASRPSKHALALVLVDLDQFIYLNDSQGHVAGDKALHKVQVVLSHIATETEACLRRIGGDEFLLAVLVDDCSGHRRLGQSTLQAVRNLKIPLTGPDYDAGTANLSATLSCSVSALSFPIRRFDTAHNLVSCRQVNRSILESLLNLCYSMNDGAKLSGRDKLIELNLCDSTA